MTDAERELDALLKGLAVRACDLMERECAVEKDMDHHVVLILLAAANELLRGLGHTSASSITAGMLPMVCMRVMDEARRRADQSDPDKN